MDNKISFTGIKNMATMTFSREGFSNCKNLSMTLSDDLAGKDLFEYKSVLQKLTPPDLINKEYPELLNLEILSDKKRRCAGLALNGQILGINDESLPLFTYIAKVTRNIRKMSDETMTVNNDYKNNFAQDTLIANGTIEYYDDLVKEGIVDTFFDKNSVREAAGEINSFIQKLMNKYFGIK